MGSVPGKQDRNSKVVDPLRQPPNRNWKPEQPEPFWQEPDPEPET